MKKVDYCWLEPLGRSAEYCRRTSVEDFSSSPMAFIGGCNNIANRGSEKIARTHPNLIVNS